MSPSSTPVAGERLAILAFTLADRHFALRASDVREIVRAVAIASLPRAPAIVEGVVNYRGAIVPVLDVRARFGLAAEPLHPSQHFILAHAGPRLVALRVEQADALVEVERHLVEPAAVAPGAQYVAGIARLPDGLLVIHDLATFLSLDEGAAVDAALAPGPSPSPGAAGP